MMQEVGQYSLSTDVIRIEFSKVAEYLIDLNIRMLYLMNNRSSLLTINKDITLECDNTFYRKITTLCSIGAFSYSSSPELGYGVNIGRYCSIAQNVKIMGAEHFTDWISTSPIFYNSGFHDVEQQFVSHTYRTRRNVIIGNDVWIGNDVVLKSDVKIGDGAIIASNSVVTKDVPDFAIVAGVPARVIKYRFDQETINRIKEIQWWKFHKKDLQGLTANNPEVFLTNLEKKIIKKEINIFSPKMVTFENLMKCSD